MEAACSAIAILLGLCGAPTAEQNRPAPSPVIEEVQNASPAVDEKRVALVVANADYAGLPLSNPEVDLAMVKPALEGMGFEVTAVVNADFVAFDTAVVEFAAKAEGADIALFYFAGHGFALGEGGRVENYLMSTSADVTSTSDRVLKRDGIPLDDIISALTEVAETTLVFVDACRNDPRYRVTGGGQGRGLAAVSIATENDVFVGLSTRLGDVATDGIPGEGSPFARAFAEKMRTPGLSVDRAFNEVRKAVYADTGVQRPEANRNDLSNPEDVVLVAAVGEATPLPEPQVDPQPIQTMAINAARDEWVLIEDSDSVAILKAFAETYPGTLYAKYALGRIAELEQTASANLDVAASVSEEEIAAQFGKTLAETEALWTRVFTDAGGRYEPATWVLFSSGTDTACGRREAGDGTFFCPSDGLVYADLTTLGELRQNIGRTSGDLAQAFIVAHAAGHQVQALNGTLAEFEKRRKTMTDEEQLEFSRRIELQADCYAGVWAADSANTMLLTPAGALAIREGSAIGDHTFAHLAEEPRELTHATFEQRRQAFESGAASGDHQDCDTFLDR